VVLSEKEFKKENFKITIIKEKKTQKGIKDNGEDD